MAKESWKLKTMFIKEISQRDSFMAKEVKIFYLENTMRESILRGSSMVKELFIIHMMRYMRETGNMESLMVTVFCFLNAIRSSTCWSTIRK